jgi:hypothetical protein
MSDAAGLAGARVARGVALLVAVALVTGYAVGRLAGGAAPPPPIAAGGAGTGALAPSDVETLARGMERLRADVEALRAAIPDAERQFFAGERARFRAALRRGRAQVVAWRKDQQGEMQAVGDRARDTIDAFVARLEPLADMDALAAWFDQYVATRQQWPPNQAWLLPELTWK